MEDEHNAQTQQQCSGEPQTQGDNGAQAPQSEPAQEHVSLTDTAAEAANETAPAANEAYGKHAAVANEWQRTLDAKDAEIARLKDTAAEQKTAYELQLAGARNVKAARALLAEHKGDIAALKVAEPWMFTGAETADASAGATGLANAGAASDEGATLKRWRRLAGLEDET